VIILYYQQQYFRAYVSAAGLEGIDVINGATQGPVGASSLGQPLAFHLGGVVGKLYDVSNRLLEFFDECTRMPSVLAVAFPGTATIEVVVDQQSSDLPDVQQTNYLAHAQDSRRPDVPYDRKIYSKKRRSSNKYKGGKRIR
jgi:hypothetical protein|tara:strand:+ start:8764 stop:9186 length:423 start_codon:yes stop_codon:yes gene_type:complete